MTNTEKAVAKIQQMYDAALGTGGGIIADWKDELAQVLALLDRKPDPTEVSTLSTWLHGWAELFGKYGGTPDVAGQKLEIGANLFEDAADLLDQQARHIAITDEALKVKDSLNEALRAEIDKLKKERR